MIPNQGGDHIYSNKNWTSIKSYFVALVFIAGIVFLGPLDFVTSSSIINSWADSLYQLMLPRSSSFDHPVDNLVVWSCQVGVPDPGTESCEEWLERRDSLVYSRDFRNDPIFFYASDLVSSFFFTDYLYR